MKTVHSKVCFSFFYIADETPGEPVLSSTATTVTTNKITTTEGPSTSTKITSSMLLGNKKSIKREQ